MKEHLVISHPISVHLYLNSYGFNVVNDFARKFYEDILHLVPARVYDTNGDDFKSQLENKVYKLSLDKTPNGLIECEECIKAVLDSVCDDLVVRGAETKMLNVIDLTQHKLTIEIDDIGEHNANSKRI